MEKEATAPERRSQGRGEEDYSQNKKIVTLPRSQCIRTGILGYRRQRSVAEFSRTICDALNREARLAKLTGVNTAPEVLSDMSEWIGRGCLP